MLIDVGELMDEVNSMRNDVQNCEGHAAPASKLHPDICITRRVTTQFSTKVVGIIIACDDYARPLRILEPVERTDTSIVGTSASFGFSRRSPNVTGATNGVSTPLFQG